MKNPHASITLTKFEVAERQLTQAIRLFFEKGDVVSIHTLAEAASQVLHDIGGDYGTTSIARDTNRIRPERQKEWFALLHSSRNFFKHANKDKDNVHVFKDMFNDMSIIDAVNMHLAIKRHWTPETLMFFVWFGMSYPDLLIENSTAAEVVAKIINNPRSPATSDKQFFGRVSAMLWSGELTMPNIATYIGLPPTDG